MIMYFTASLLCFDGCTRDVGTAARFRTHVRPHHRRSDVPGMTNRLAGAAIITYQILLAAIILIRPEIDPTHKPISEYAIGRLGWVAVLAFLVAATAYALLFAAVCPLVRGRLGPSLLGICVLGTFGVGIFVADPVVTPWSAMTTVGRLHVVCGLSALVLLPFAAL